MVHRVISLIGHEVDTSPSRSPSDLLTFRQLFVNAAIAASRAGS
jgi:hypothetical protein